MIWLETSRFITQTLLKNSVITKPSPQSPCSGIRGEAEEGRDGASRTLKRAGKAVGVDPRAGRLCARASSPLCSPLPVSVALRVEGLFASITASARATRCCRLRGTTCAAPPRRPRLHPAIASVAEPPLTRPHRGRHSCHACCHQQASLSRRFTVGDAAVCARGGGRGAGGAGGRGAAGRL